MAIRKRTEDARKAIGATWDLELVLSRDGEQCPLATLARFEKRNEFTPELRREVTRAVRLAVISYGPKRSRKPEKGS
jgi:hypothetical protein